MYHAAESEMRTKRATIHLEANALARRLDVVVQQLEPWILPHPQPYDAGPPKVREGANSSELHVQFAVPAGDRCNRSLNLTRPFRWLLAKKF